MDKRHGWISTKAEGNRNTLKQRMQRNVLERSVEKFIAGYDTVGIRASYQKNTIAVRIFGRLIVFLVQ